MVTQPGPGASPAEAGVSAGVPAPSAAAAAGAAAAALLQRQLADDVAADGDRDIAEPRADNVNAIWTEHQTGDGRKFYYHEETQTSVWEKPKALMSAEERHNDTPWRDYKIWDGRVFYHNRDTNVSCWRMPPELRKLRGEPSGVDDRPLPDTSAEKRRAFREMLQEKGVDESWNWQAVVDATRGEPQAECLDDLMQQQVFAEVIGFSLRQRQIEDRERQRNAANAFERLIEERFGGPEDLEATYEDAKRLLSHEEAWELIKSDVRRDEVFQKVMERLEEKHRKARADRRSERVQRLQRLLASDAELTRPRLRWKDAMAILAKRDELMEEDPPLEALRIWASIRDIKPATEHQHERKSSSEPDPSLHRGERKRRDNFVAGLKEAAMRGKLTTSMSWDQFRTFAAEEEEPRFSALRDGLGATAQELFDEFQEELRQGAVLSVNDADGPPPPAELEDVVVEPIPKRQRAAEYPNAAETAAQAAAAAVEAAVASRTAAAALKIQEVSLAVEGAGPSIAPTEHLSQLDAMLHETSPVLATASGDDPLMNAADNAFGSEDGGVVGLASAAQLASNAAAAAALAAAAADTPAAEAVQTISPFTATELQAKKVDDLKQLCRDRALPVSGRKQELIDRLMQHR